MIQEPPQSDPEREGGGNAAVAWLRFFIWLMPSALVPGLILLVGWAFVALRKLGLTGNLQDAQGFVVLFWVIGSMVGVIGLGYLDSRLKRQQEKISREEDRSDDGWHMLQFFVVQIALVPCLVFAVVVMMWLVAGSIRP